MNVCVLLCAGRSERFGGDKLLTKLCNLTVFEHSLISVSCSGVFDEIVVVSRPLGREKFAVLAQLHEVRVNFCDGGITRQASVKNALEFIEREFNACETVTIHDCARCLATSEMFAKCVKVAIAAAPNGGQILGEDSLCSARKIFAAVCRYCKKILRSNAQNEPYKMSGVGCSGNKSVGGAAVGKMAVDTIKQVDGKTLTNTLDRSKIALIETPQSFDFLSFLIAHKAVGERKFTDDSTLFCANGGNVELVQFREFNQKFTFAEDIVIFQGVMLRRPEIYGICTLPANCRSGFGTDVHAFAEGRPLILGGVNIPSGKGLDGHSDADVVTHAVMDALLGAAGLGDIGEHFPDTDIKFKGADSIALLEYVTGLLHSSGYIVNNVDVQLIMQAPKIGEYKKLMRENLAKAMKISSEYVNIGATTTEYLGFIGRGEGATASATCTIREIMSGE